VRELNGNDFQKSGEIFSYLLGPFTMRKLIGYFGLAALLLAGLLSWVATLTGAVAHLLMALTVWYSSGFLYGVVAFALPPLSDGYWLVTHFKWSGFFDNSLLVLGYSLAIGAYLLHWVLLLLGGAVLNFAYPENEERAMSASA
jgi:hypothetical protein